MNWLIELLIDLQNKSRDANVKNILTKLIEKAVYAAQPIPFKKVNKFLWLAMILNALSFFYALYWILILGGKTMAFLDP